MSYPGNFVADDSFADDPSCPGWKPQQYYDAEEPEFCCLCGTLISICGGDEVLDEVVCADCYANVPIEEITEIIKKLKK
jgi:hypothetical protein